MAPDIVLTHAYRLAEDAHERRHMMPYPPLGLLGLAPWLRREGHACAVVDATFDDRAGHLARLAALDAPVLGIYANMMTRAASLDLITVARARGQRVVLGGPDPSEYAREYLEAGADVVVIGEGERSLTALLPRLLDTGTSDLEGLPGLAWLGPGGAMRQGPPRPPMPRLDGLPWPDREAIDLQPYLRCWREHHGRSSLNLVTARGCAWRCRWCSHAVFGHHHARRRPDDVAEEVAWIVERYAPDQLWYADDVFTASPRWLGELAEAMETRGLRLPFECITRADRVDEHVARLLERLGCFRVWLGSESGSPRMLEAMERGVTPDQIRAATRLLQARGIRVGFFVMWGYEGETRRDIELTLRHLQRCRPDEVLSTVAYPIRGTPYYDAVAERVVARRPWHEGSDRDHALRGRPGPRYYAQLSRRLRLEHELRGLRSTPGPGRWPRRVRASLGLLAARLGMRWRVHEHEA